MKAKNQLEEQEFCSAFSTFFCPACFFPPTGEPAKQMTESHLLGLCPVRSLLNKKIRILLSVLIRFNLDKTFPSLFHCAFSHLLLWHFLSSKRSPLLCSLLSLLFPPVFLPVFLHTSIHLPFIFPVLYPYGPPAVSDILLFLPCFVNRYQVTYKRFARKY